ncbi:protein of unknown function [Candidatus Hydrogenisulfobacillus filiaventi]|uniref:Uncharacterized protein n=1 Tax=Candidatus Hydrogenisulfobacillus filiaventi TaxID=2707344 RepID=A0A6F8ZDJ3_9FIRM|nr:protein of unknown function [Candidatus Hydrogenisulfobacillus filiaventi]
MAATARRGDWEREAIWAVAHAVNDAYPSLYVPMLPLLIAPAALPGGGGRAAGRPYCPHHPAAAAALGLVGGRGGRALVHDRGPVGGWGLHRPGTGLGALLRVVGGAAHAGGRRQRRLPPPHGRHRLPPRPPHEHPAA